MQVEDLFDTERDLVAYRIHGLSMEPVRIFGEAPQRNVTVRNRLEPFMKTGGLFHIPELGFIDVSRAGLYRLHRLSDNFAIQWIVFDDDPLVFAASIASVFYHFADEPDPRSLENGMFGLYQYVTSAMIKGQVPAGCTTAAIFFAIAARNAGFDSVFWQISDPHNKFLPASTHVMAEIRNPKDHKTILVDIDRKLYFESQLGECLSFVDFIRRVKTGDPIVIKKLSNARFSGYGIARRVSARRDFLHDILEYADEALLFEMHQMLGNAPYIYGTRLYGNEPGQKIIPAIIRDPLHQRIRSKLDTSPTKEEEQISALIEISETADF